MTEFIDDLFGIHSPYGTPNLHTFAELVNRETFWVVTEVTKEININRRVQILKRFIKVCVVVIFIHLFSSTVKTLICFFLSSGRYASERMSQFQFHVCNHIRFRS